MKALLFLATTVLFAASVHMVSADTSLAQVFAELEQQYGLPAGTLAKIAQAESGFNPTARARCGGCTAYGLFQWLTTSWEHASRALYGFPLNPNMRSNPTVAAKVTAFALGQARTRLQPLIQQLKIDMTAGLYMSHFLGPAGAEQFFKKMLQDPNAAAASFFPRAAQYNRPIFFNGGRPRSFSEIVQLMARKLGVSTAVPIAGDFTGPAGVSLARSFADVRPQDYIPLAQVPRTDTERDYPTTYTFNPSSLPLSGLNSGGSGRTGSGTYPGLLGSQSQATPVNPVYIPSQVSPIESSTFFTTTSASDSPVSATPIVASTTAVSVLNAIARSEDIHIQKTSVSVSPILGSASRVTPAEHTTAGSATSPDYGLTLHQATTFAESPDNAYRNISQNDSLSIIAQVVTSIQRMLQSLTASFLGR